jgi:hypothetical protein
MTTQKISFMAYGMTFLLVLFILVGSSIFLASQLAYAHTFSSNESADFLSLVDQIRAETALVPMNLEKNNNNVTLAQAHAEKASRLLTNSTLDEIWEVNTRIADGLETGLEQLEGNITSLGSSIPQGQIPQDRIQSINQTVMTLNDLLAETVTVRIESEERNNATTWALVLADLVNVVLSNYGNATNAPFDLTDMSNLASMGEGMQMDHSHNTTTMTMMNQGQMQMSGNSSDNNTMTITTSNATTTSAMSNMTASIVDASAYQSAQYLANNTVLQLFNDMLKPLTINADEASTSNNNTTTMAQQGQNNTTSGNNRTSNIDALEAKLLQLKDDINGKVTPTEVMTTVHLGIHPILMQLYGLTVEQ